MGVLSAPGHMEITQHHTCHMAKGHLDPYPYILNIIAQNKDIKIVQISASKLLLLLLYMKVKKCLNT
jgi:hypothetical protein